MNKEKQILIFEDNSPLRESLSYMLNISGKYSVCGAFPDCKDCVKLVKELNPDIVLMDIDMPGMTGIEAVKSIRTFNKSVQILMLTIFDDNTHIFEAIYAGANGYLLKKFVSSKLTDFMDECLEGGAPMSPSVARQVIGKLQKKEDSATTNYGLTKREREILRSLSQGNSYKMMAIEFEISIDTVRTHIKRIYEKLHVHSQTEAVAKAINEKLV